MTEMFSRVLAHRSSLQFANTTPTACTPSQDPSSSTIGYGYKTDSVVRLGPRRLPDCGVDRVERTQIGRSGRWARASDRTLEVQDEDRRSWRPRAHRIQAGHD